MMPLYQYRCECGNRFEEFKKLVDYQAPAECACGALARRAISAPMISVVNYDYECPITGKAVMGKAAHEDNLRRHGCRLYEPGETEGQVRAREAADNAFESAVGETIERTIDSWSGDKRERLAAELTSGVDVNVERGTAPCPN